MNSRSAVLIALAFAALSGAIVTAVVFAAAIYLSGRAHAESLDAYGFTAPPYNYSDEYHDCAWPDDGSGRRYQPGYPGDREWSRCGEEKPPPPRSWTYFRSVSHHAEVAVLSPAMQAFRLGLSTGRKSIWGRGFGLYQKTNV